MKKTMDRWKKLGNDADGRRSETFGGHEMTLQEQIQQSMDAEASQVPVELLHNWIDRRNRASRTASAAMRNNQQQQHQPIARQANNNNPNFQHESQQQAPNNNQASNWRYSGGDLESRGGGAATTLTTLTTTPTKSQSQTLPTQDELLNNNNTTRCGGANLIINVENTDTNETQNQCLVNIRSSPNSPDRQTSQRQNDFSQMRISYQQDHDLQQYQRQQQPLTAGHSIELKITNASVNSEENLDYVSTTEQGTNHDRNAKPIIVSSNDDSNNFTNSANNNGNPMTDNI